jgi:zinc transporter ZupT
MLFLIAALIGLALGPLVFNALHRSPATQLALDGFVLVAVVGLVISHILPEAFESAGWWSILAASAGLLLPLTVEKLRALSHNASHGVVLGVAGLALLLHASVDGVGLAAAEGSSALALAVVLHRLPVGLAVWWLVCPQFGRRWAALVLAALGVATVSGYGMQIAFAPSEGIALHLVQAFVAGSLLHVLLHQAVGFHDHADETVGWRVSGTLGAVAGFALVLFLPGVHHEVTFGARLWAVALASSPLLLALIALAVVSMSRKGDEPFARQALRVLDKGLPWAVLALVAGALLGEPLEIAPSAPTIIAAACFSALVLVSVAHQGPRDFALVILPLEVTAHDHAHHEHDEAHEHEHQSEPAYDAASASDELQAAGSA